MSSRVRKYDSGCEKRKKKKRLEVCAQTQKGALDRFIVKDQNTTRNPTTEMMLLVKVMALKLTLLKLM
jgi:hypothetical protein